MPIWRKSKPKKSGSASKPSSPPSPRVDVADAQSPVAEKVFCLAKATRLRGELEASANVEIQGEVEGKVRVEGFALVVAECGRAVADIHAREVVVHGLVTGDVFASERIVIESSGTVLGDICAPSIRLADGSRFTGSINKESAPAKVTGRLSGDSGGVSQAQPRQSSQALMRRRTVSERRGSTRPWGSESRRGASRRAPEPTPTA